MKNIILFLFLSFIPTVNLFAQTIPADSIKIKTKIAIADARHFKSTKAIRVAHRHRLLLNTSDYFTPATSIKHPQYLKDSVYVQAYRDAAYNKSVHGNLGYIHYKPDLSTKHIVEIVLVSVAVIIGTIYFVKLVKNAAVIK